MKKDRVVIKDFVSSVLCAGGVAALIVMVFIPIVMFVLGKSISINLPVFSVYAGAFESVSVAEAITHIVLGAMVIQYMRLYMFMGLTRERAFLRTMMVEGITLIASFIFLAFIGIISGLFTGTLSISSIFLSSLYITFSCALMFGVGCVSSALSTTCRPPLSVAVVIIFLSFMLWLYARATNMVRETLRLGDEIKIIFRPEIFDGEAVMALIFGVAMVAISFIIYKLPISQMKSTSIS